MKVYKKWRVALFALWAVLGSCTVAIICLFLVDLALRD